jgi:RNA polymerase sigma-70 factor, ECF subfamily
MIHVNRLTNLMAISDGEEADRTEEFVRLFSQHESLVRGFLLTLLPNRSEVDDLFQRTSIVLWRKFRDFHPGTDFGAWACQIAKLEVRNYLRVRSRDRLHFSDALLTSLADVRQALSDELDLRREALRHCVAKLRPADQEIIQHCYGPQSTTAKDAAEKLSRPVNTLYKALIRIRSALYECVERALKASGY